MIFVSNLLSNIDPTLTAEDSVENMLTAGVNRLLAMQTPSGGFGVWPGESQPVPWGTAYVTHTLIDAQKAGYAVPQERINEALQYMEQEVEKAESGAATYDFKYGMDVAKWEPYVHYVLALGGRGRKARVEKLIQAAKADARGEEGERIYLLKAALYLAGDRRFESDLKRPDTSAVSNERSWDWSFYSDLRRRGFMLNVFQDLFGSDQAGQALADLVADGLKRQTSAYFSTQELSWGASGLGKRVGQASAEAFKEPALIANGKKVEPQANPAGAKSADRTWGLARASELKSLALEAPPGISGKLYLVLTSEGVRADGKYKTGGEGLSVTRKFREIGGGSVSFAGGGHKLGDLVFSEVTITNTSSEKVTNIALVDRFPAGWEIENPRLGRGVAAAWIDADTLWQPDYLDIRDDRLQVFGSLSPRESRTVVYTLRVVTAGTFVMPPVEATAMYNPRVWAREAGRSIEVKGPWADLIE